MVVRVSRRLSVLAALIVAVVSLTAADAWARATATSLRLGTHPDGVTRLVVDLSEAIDFSTALYADPYRLVINTPPMGWAEPATLKHPFGAVRSLRFDEDSLGGRVMVELKSPAVVKSSFVIPPRDGQGWRLVLDLQTVSRTVFLGAAMPVRVAAPMVETKAALQVPSPAKTASLPVPEARPDTALAVTSAAPDTSRTIVISSPQAVPAAAPRPEVKTVSMPAPSMPAPAPTPVTVQAAPSTAVQTTPPLAVQTAATQPVMRSGRNGGGAPMLSGPVPPLSTSAAVAPSPQETAAVPAMAAPPPEPAAIVTKVSAPLPAPQPIEPAAPKALPADGKPVVVIDPGHGGVDPGAIGVSGIYEKYITLAVARELKAQLERNGRYKVHLTRDRDVFIRLRDRVAIARQYNADLFISLHADTVSNAQMRGLSVYTLSQNASDSEAQALADKENKADLIAGIDLSHESADVANILIDLAQRETMNRSAGFAGGVVDEVGREVTLLGNTHRFAGFAVLKAPDVPAVLIETGYLSNEVEERALRQPEYRTKLAKGIARAVDHFFLQGQKARRP